METIKNLFLKHSLFKFKIKIVVPSERKKFTSFYTFVFITFYLSLLHY